MKKRKNLKKQRPSDDRVSGGIPTQRECVTAAKVYAELKRPAKPPVKAALVIAVAVALLACNSDTPALAVQRAGFTDFEDTGWKWNACSGESSHGRSFRAKDSAGHVVTGTTCCDRVRDCAVRVDR